MKICLESKTENLPHPTYLWRVSCSTKETRWFNKKKTDWHSTSDLIVTNNYINNNNSNDNDNNNNNNNNNNSDINKNLGGASSISPSFRLPQWLNYASFSSAY